MKWAHRGVPAEVKMQGQLYGVHIEDTPAGFSSRFQARSNAPGIRCRVLTKVDFEDSFLRETLARDNINIDDYSAGDLIPWNGGEYFASVSRSGGVTRIHADINAAQNLQRRFWTRFSEPFRIPCSLVTEEENKIWVPRTLGKRIVGAMDGFGELIPTGHKSGSCRWNGITARRYRQIGGDSGENTESTDPEMQELEALAEAAIERSSEYETFFRDPSGNVLPKGLWFPSQHFWSVVKAKTASALK
jgi:hypothetical protein